MPELPEVEVAKRQIKDNVINFKVHKVKHFSKNGKPIRLRKEIDTKSLNNLLGKKFEKIKRCGKYLFLKFEDYCLVVHFGMTGMLYCNIKSDKHEVIRIEAESGDFLSYCDIRKFGVIEVIKSKQVSNYITKLNLGIEPLSEDIDYSKFKNLMGNYKKSIKDFLLDQSKISGLGNIYASELCFDLKINPFNLASEYKQIAKKIIISSKKVLIQAIENGGSTINNYASPTGKKGNAQINHKVYGRANLPCYECGELIESASQSGRTTFFCRNCQSIGWIN